MVEYQRKTSSGVAKAGLATAIAAGAVTLLNGNNNPLSNLLGGNQQASATETALLMPLIMQAYAGGGGGGHHNHHHDDDRYVTKEVLDLVRENADLKAKNSATEIVKAETDPIKARVCSLETGQAVNAARDHDFRHYVDREFVHQPKASIRKSIVTCKQCGCECCCESGEGA